MKSLYLIYRGNVQGVGFRFTARHLAQKFEIKGWVKNLADGSVEMFVQGKEDKIEEFLQEIQRYFKGYIQQIEQTQQIYREEIKDFQIRF